MSTLPASSLSCKSAHDTSPCATRVLAEEWPTSTTEHNRDDLPTHVTRNVDTILLVGSSCSGKTAFVRRIATGEWCKDASGVTPSATTHRMEVSLRGDEVLTLDMQEWTTPALDARMGTPRGAIAMVDMQNRQSLIDGEQWLVELRRALGDSVPIVLCGNKIDQPTWKVKSREMQELARRYNCTYVPLSSKSCYNLYKPFKVLGI